MRCLFIRDSAPETVIKVILIEFEFLQLHQNSIRVAVGVTAGKLRLTANSLTPLLKLLIVSLWICWGAYVIVLIRASTGIAFQCIRLPNYSTVLGNCLWFDRDRDRERGRDSDGRRTSQSRNLKCIAIDSIGN